MLTDAESFAPGENIDALSYFDYIPSKPLAIASLVVFAFIKVFFFLQVLISKKASFLYVLSFTAALECVGYAVRILCVEYTDWIDLL